MLKKPQKLLFWEFTTFFGNSFTTFLGRFKAIYYFFGKTNICFLKICLNPLIKLFFYNQKNINYLSKAVNYHKNAIKNRNQNVFSLKNINKLLLDSSLLIEIWYICRTK